MESPATFKIGYTHNPYWRWSNPLYGYTSALSREKFHRMIVVYVADQPHGPSMLEAALIRIFKRASSEIIFFVDIFLETVMVQLTTPGAIKAHT